MFLVFFSGVVAGVVKEAKLHFESLGKTYFVLLPVLGLKLDTHPHTHTHTPRVVIICLPVHTYTFLLTHFATFCLIVIFLPTKTIYIHSLKKFCHIRSEYPPLSHPSTNCVFKVHYLAEYKVSSNFKIKFWVRKHNCGIMCAVVSVT